MKTLKDKRFKLLTDLRKIYAMFDTMTIFNTYSNLSYHKTRPNFMKIGKVLGKQKIMCKNF